MTPPHSEDAASRAGTGQGPPPPEPAPATVGP
jgi:hypothetical protein